MGNGRTGSDTSRREFARLFAAGGSLALFGGMAPVVGHGQSQPPPLSPAPASPDEPYWRRVREQFLMPPRFVCLNAANLCPSPAPVIDAYFEPTRAVERDPSPQNRQKTRQGREAARRSIAAALRVTPEEIVMTRNTSESNNFVSSGLDLKAGDEVLVFSDNHPSNLAAWRQKAQRFGYTVHTIAQVNPHPGAEHYIEAFRKAITPATKVVALTHVTASVGDVLPVKEICAMARQHGAVSLVDGAQSFGVLDVDLSDLQPDFYTGSAHKWPCGPKEAGVLYVNTRVHDRIKPSIVSLYPGEVGISRTLEAFGQRDEPALMGFDAALAFQKTIGRTAVERRARDLASMLIDGLQRIPDVKIWTAADPSRRAAIVSFQPGSLNVNRLHQALYEKDGIICATRGGADRPGLRFSPHVYNTADEVRAAIDALHKYVKQGL